MALKTSQWIFQFLAGYDRMALRHGEEIVWAALSNAATDHDIVLNLTHHTSFRLAGRGDILGLICSLPRGESRRHEPSLLLLCEQALRQPGSAVRGSMSARRLRCFQNMAKGMKIIKL